MGASAELTFSLRGKNVLTHALKPTSEPIQTITNQNWHTSFCTGSSSGSVCPHVSLVSGLLEFSNAKYNVGIYKHNVTCLCRILNHSLTDLLDVQQVLQNIVLPCLLWGLDYLSEQTSIRAFIQPTLSQAFVWSRKRRVCLKRVMSPNTCEPLYLS